MNMYIKIDYNNMVLLTTDFENMEQIPKIEIDRIRSFVLSKSIHDIDIKYPKTYSKYSFQLEYDIDDKRFFNIMVYKSTDEWYYLMTSLVEGSKLKRNLVFQDYYRCDQFDGMLSALENVMILNDL